MAMQYTEAQELAARLTKELARLDAHQDGPYLGTVDGDMNRWEITLYWSASGLIANSDTAPVTLRSAQDVEDYIANGCKPRYALDRMRA